MPVAMAEAVEGLVAAVKRVKGFKSRWSNRHKPLHRLLLVASAHHFLTRAAPLFTQRIRGAASAWTPPPLPSSNLPPPLPPTSQARRCLPATSPTPLPQHDLLLALQEVRPRAPPHGPLCPALSPPRQSPRGFAHHQAHPPLPCHPTRVRRANLPLRLGNFSPSPSSSSSYCHCNFSPLI